tara:strand:- start:252 stop:698 length:447 start_codon:yes stop_codon:yes gene_type:complete
MGVETALFISAVGSTLSYKANMDAAKNKAKKYQEIRKVAALRALQEANLRTDQETITLSNNRTVAGAAGILDDSRSFIAIQNKVKSDAAKDLGNIRLNGLLAQSDLDVATVNNKLDRQSLTFGYLSDMGSYAYTGYAYNNPPTEAKED